MFRSSIKLFKIFGIEVGLNYSWFIIFALITFTLTTSFFPTSLPNASVAVYIVLGVITSILFFFSVLFHEISHSLVARKNGILIDKISLFVFGGVAQMTKEPDTPRAELLMAIAGPLFSIVLGALFGAVYFIFRYVYPVEFISVPVGYLAYINVLLGIFNLIPGFPLDGGRVLRAIIWYSTKDLRKSTRIAASVGEGFGFVLILIGIFLLFRGDWGNGLWLMFLGWFLHQAAAGSYEQVIISQSLSALKASDMMTKDIVSVSSTIHLDELVHEWFMRYRFGRFPVVDGDQIYGIVTIHDVKSIPRDEWSTKNVLDIIKPISPDEIISSDEHASTVLGRMSSKGITEFLVISEKKLVGIITKSDILRALKLQRAFSDN